MKSKTMAAVDRVLRPYMTEFLPPHAVTWLYSNGRVAFLRALENELPPAYLPPKELERTMWGITFRAPLMNAAGMFKNGGGYYLVARQGAGGYVYGTSTADGSYGNKKEGIHLPFAPLPRSHAALNWLGLNNYGDDVISSNISEIIPVYGCPIIASVAESPSLRPEERLPALASGMHKHRKAGASVIQVNKSCPNTGDMQGFDEMEKDLRYLKEHFIEEADTPVVAKLSTDTSQEQIPRVMDTLFRLGYGGVDFGNTSIDYSRIRRWIHQKDRKLFDYFTKAFGGGVSGRPLREISLDLCSRAAEYLRSGPPQQEFHIWRTGGIGSARDIADSETAGVSMNLWFTGYFEAFARDGHDVYRNLYKDYMNPPLRFPIF